MGRASYHLLVDPFVLVYEELMELFISVSMCDIFLLLLD